MNLEFLSHCIFQAHTEISAGNYDEGITWCTRALEVHPNLSEAWFNLGLAHKGLGNRPLAIQSFENASLCAPDSADAQNGNGLALLELGCEEKAELCLARAITLNSADPAPLANLALLRKNQKRLNEAASLLIKAINLAPNIAVLYSNLAGILNRLSLFNDAVLAAKKAIALDHKFADAWNNLSIALARLDQHKEATEAANTAYALNPSLSWLQGSIVYSQLKICDWSDLKERISGLISDITHHKPSVEPLTLLSIIDDPALQQQCGAIYTQALFPTSENALGRYNNSKIKVGYISSDFRTHAVSFLTAGLIEAHDRSRFEVHGFDLGQPDDSAYKQRMLGSFDTAHSLFGKSSQEMIECIRSNHIDILIDLNGHTKDAVTDVFAARAAPVQINFLGFPGTMGASFIDYIIGDSHVIPEESAHFYTEKIIYLPECFQPNDPKREIGSEKPRNYYGLKEDHFVFACFNQSAKITPDIFNAWMDILAQVPNSALWLAIQNPDAQRNLSQHALDKGISADRIIFAAQVDYAEHLMRHSHVDLMLDTYPFNGGTTTSDALWAGSPVLSLAGKSFASRMGASLLHNIGLAPLVTTSIEDYKNLAIHLTLVPARLDALRTQLRNNLQNSPLFNAQRYTQYFEKGLEMAVARYRAGLNPEPINVLG